MLVTQGVLATSNVYPEKKKVLNAVTFLSLAFGNRNRNPGAVILVSALHVITPGLGFERLDNTTEAIWACVCVCV